jgi:hypothetical protein
MNESEVSEHAIAAETSLFSSVQVSFETVLAALWAGACCTTANAAFHAVTRRCESI